jgi:tRNA A-37 threonylcarbamoyl transferase component Bud32
LAASAKLFQSNQYQQLFAQHQLADFGAIWARDIAWFEPPNERRGGWSGVGTMALQGGTLQGSIHAPLRLFVKKQQNHGRKSWRHPLAGEPTFRREFANLKFLAKHNIGAPKLVFYAENICFAENLAAKQAILITEELIDFVPLDTVQLSNLNQAQQHTLIQTVATEIKRFHNAGLVHRALYPKHIFVKNAQTAAEIAFIDLEKARHSNYAWYRAYFDLAAFTRHAIGWSADNKQLFIKTYFAKQELNFFDKLLCNMINRRAKRG